MKAVLFIAAALILTTAPQAKADHLATQTFADTVTALNSNPETIAVQPVFDSKVGLTILSESQINQLAVISKSQGEIWGDTILEGDYEADGKTQVDHVDALTKDGALVAYRIVYSERAWDTSGCTYPANLTRNALAQCEEGRIEEASFVSPDLQSWTRDPKAFANFISK